MNYISRLVLLELFRQGVRGGFSAAAQPPHSLHKSPMQFMRSTVSLIWVSAEQVLQHGAAEVQQDDRTSAGWLCRFVRRRWDAGRRNPRWPCTMASCWSLRLVTKFDFWTPAGILVDKGVLMRTWGRPHGGSSQEAAQVETTCGDGTLKSHRPRWASGLPSVMVSCEH